MGQEERPRQYNLMVIEPKDQHDQPDFFTKKTTIMCTPPKKIGGSPAKKIGQLADPRPTVFATTERLSKMDLKPWLPGKDVASERFTMIRITVQDGNLSFYVTRAGSFCRFLL